MNYKEFLAKVNSDFALALTIEKEKAAYLMLCPNGTLGGWDCGHSRPSMLRYVETPNGWGYALIEGEWYRLPNGMVGWRSGAELPQCAGFPDSPAGTRL